MKHTQTKTVFWCTDLGQGMFVWTCLCLWNQQIEPRMNEPLVNFDHRAPKKRPSPTSQETPLQLHLSPWTPFPPPSPPPPQSPALPSAPWPQTAPQTARRVDSRVEPRVEPTAEAQLEEASEALQLLLLADDERDLEARGVESDRVGRSLAVMQASGGGWGVGELGF